MVVVLLLTHNGSRGRGPCLQAHTGNLRRLLWKSSIRLGVMALRCGYVCGYVWICSVEVALPLPLPLLLHAGLHPASCILHPVTQEMLDEVCV